MVAKLSPAHEVLLAPLDIPTLWGHFEPLCKRVNMRSKTKGSKVYCVGVRPAA